ALADAPATSARPGDARPARELLGDLSAAEDAAVRGVLVGPDKAFERLEWSEVAAQVWWPGVAREVEPVRRYPVHCTPRVLPAALGDVDGIARAVRMGVSAWSPAAERRHAIRCLALQLGACLRDAGFAPAVGPGLRFEMRRGDDVVEPLRTVDDL